MNVGSATLAELVTIFLRPHMARSGDWSQEAFTDCYETRNVEHSIRYEVVKLDALVEEQVVKYLCNGNRNPHITNGNRSTLCCSDAGDAFWVYMPSSVDAILPTSSFVGKRPRQEIRSNSSSLTSDDIHWHFFGFVNVLV